jgi:hypothetical protein
MWMQHVQNDIKLMSWQHVGFFWNIVLYFGILSLKVVKLGKTTSYFLINNMKKIRVQLI